MPQSIDILTLVAADLSALDSMFSGSGAGTVQRTTTWTLDQTLNFHEAHNCGVGGSGANGRLLFDQDGQVVSVQLVAPIGMLPILADQQFSHSWTQSGMPAMIRTDFAPQCLHRIPLRVASCIEPPLNSRLTKLNWLSGDGMMPLFGCQAFELLLELAPVGRSSQQGADHAETEACPLLVRTTRPEKIRHRAFHFLLAL